jgi:hypothetical protein
MLVCIAAIQAVTGAMSPGTVVRFAIGAVMVICGLLLLLQGVRVGLIPIGSTMGSALPLHGMTWLLGIAFILGLVVTAAEPDVRVLSLQVDVITGGELGRGALVLAVAAGVAVFTTLALLRIVVGIPIIWLFLGGHALIASLVPFVPPQYLPLAFDAGGVTTGPLTVPFLLALGLGTTAVLARRSSFGDGFGIVGLASIGPVIAVMLLGVFWG